MASSWGPVIDVDVHLHESPAELARYAAGTLRQTLELDPGLDRFLDTPGYSPLTMYDPPLGEVATREPHRVTSAAVLREDMARLGVDAAVVFPGRLLALPTRPEPFYPVEIMQAYNRWLRDRWLDPDHGIFGAILTASQDPDASVREIETNAADPGFVAVHLGAAAVYPLWGDRGYDPIFAAAEAAGLPVVLQGYTIVHTVFPYNLERIETALAKQVLAQPFGAAANLVSMVTGGVFARFPRLQVLFPECGVSWLPPVLWRLDAQARYLPHEVEVYGGSPGAAIRDRVFVTTHSPELTADPHALVALLDAAGLDNNVLFASDWPHYDADRPARLRDLPLPDAWKRRVLSENARRVLRLPNGWPH